MEEIGGRRLVLLVALMAALLAAATAVVLVRRAPRFVSPTSATYEEMSRAYYHGLAALQVGLLDDAKTQFTRATEIVPGEPAAWANLGLTHLRLGELDPASQTIDRAAALAPASSEIAFLQGQVETGRGRPEAAIARFRRAVDLDPRGLRVRYALAQEVESAGGPNADAEAQALLDQLVTLGPDNVAALLERARLAAKRSDGRLLQDSVASLEMRANSWPAVAIEQYRALQRATLGQDFQEAARSVAVLRNVLLRVPAFREDLLAIRTPAELIAEPFDCFLRLPAPASRPSPPDAALTFSRESIGPDRPSPWSTLLAFSSDGTSLPAVFAADARDFDRVSAPGAVLPFPGGSGTRPPSASGVLAIDWNRDFRMDLVLAGAGGVRLFIQDADGTFRDATAAAAGNAEAVTPTVLAHGPPISKWTATSTSSSASTAARRSCCETTATARGSRLQPFAGVVGLRAFAWGDIDGDGDPDAALLDAGGAACVREPAGGQFEPMAGPAARPVVVALALGDINGDGVSTS